MPNTQRKTQEEPLVEAVPPEDEARAEQLAHAWQLSQTPRDLWPELEKLLPTSIDDVMEAAKQAQKSGLPFVDLEKHPPEPSALACLPGELARKHDAIPVRKDANRLFVALKNPRDIVAIDAMRAHTRLLIQPLVAAPSQIEIALEEFYPETAPSGDRGAVPPVTPTAVGAGPSGEDPDDYPSFAAFLEEREAAPDALLTARQEKWLARVIERGGPQGERAREILVNANLRLVTSIARKYENRGLDMAELIQEGVLGLIHAIGGYDWRRGFRFYTYATHWIRQALGRAVEGDGRSVRLPEHAVASLERIERMREQLQTQLNRPPTLEELAAATEPLERNAEILWGSLLPAEDATHPSSRVFRRALREEINRALERLSEREREVLTLRYGLSEDQSEPRTLEQVGEALQLSRDQVRQIEAGALQKLRRTDAPDRLREAVAPTPVNGEQTDFATFQKVCERRVYRRAAALCGDPDAAQTLTLDAFTHAWRVWNGLPPGTRNWAWLTALTDRLHAETRRDAPVDLSPLLSELRAIRGELAGLREENAALRSLLQP